jgi:hypothetical protein
MQKFPDSFPAYDKAHLDALIFRQVVLIAFQQMMQGNQMIAESGGCSGER